jgi:hypothetical protein
MEQIGEGVARAKLLDLGEAEVELRRLWENGPVVLAFVRHFG